MKAIKLTWGMLLLALLMLPNQMDAQVDLKGKFNKVKNNVNNNKKNNNKESENSDDNSSGSDNTGNSSSSNVGNGMNCDELATKADALYEQENYEEAWKYYEQAEKDGCVGSMDGQTRMNMNDCKKIVNTTPEEKAEQENMVNNILNQVEEQKYSRPLDEDEGVSSPTHEKNMNKIVFSKTEIVKGSEDPSTFTNSFTLGDNIYSRIYLDKSRSNYANEIGAFPYTTDYFYRITVEGYELPSLLSTNIRNTGDNESLTTWTTYQLAISPMKSDLEYYPHFQYTTFWEDFYHLPEGTYNINVELVYDIPEDEEPAGSRTAENCRKFTTKFGPEKVIAEGSFQINVKNSDKLNFSKKLSKGLPNPGKTDATLEKGMITATTGAWEGQTPVKAIITSSDWTYQRDVWGNITHRTINAAVVIRFDKEDIYKVFYMVFSEQNQGGDKYGAPQYAGGNTSELDYFIAKEFVK